MHPFATGPIPKRGGKLTPILRSPSQEIENNGEAIINRLRNLLTKAEKEHEAASTVTAQQDTVGISFAPVGAAAMATALKSLGQVGLTLPVTPT